MPDAELDATEVWLRTQRGETWPGSRQHSDAARALAAFEELRESHHLLGLIERHGWVVTPSNVEPGAWYVSTYDHCHGHRAPTLIEALTEAANCDRCCGRTP